MSEPLPDQGWSREIRVLDNALIVPPSATNPGVGVICSDGLCQEAAIWREGKNTSTPISGKPESQDVLSGTHLWGGTFFGHFGHFMVETIARLWAVRGSRAQSVLFAPKHALLRDFQSYQSRIIELLDLGIPVDIVRTPTKVERLLVPGQGFGLGKISRATPEFREMMERMAKKVTADGPEKIYISRTRFGGNGGVLAESVIEQNLTNAGYTPIYPERMSLDEQLSTYKAARIVVGLDSSAFHIFAFVADKNKKAAVILRRTHWAYRHIVDQMTHFMGSRPTVIDVLAANWMPQQRKLANHQSWGELDHPALAKALRKAGFIDGEKDWRAPSDEEIKASLKWAEERAGAPLVRRKATKKAEDI